ncbi:hypothetical protein [Saccharopolyspora hattusasensis]|uniref:hypothetical protein n=1 Tax=Saccharopolyspora hattusasensis TaxID=1128679 RepID=UPI003D967968
MLKENPKVCTSRCATWRSRGGGFARDAEGVGDVMAVAQVSVIRAVAIDACFIGGPYQARRPLAGAAVSAAGSRSRPARQRASSLPGSVPSEAPA